MAETLAFMGVRDTASLLGPAARGAVRLLMQKVLATPRRVCIRAGVAALVMGMGANAFAADRAAAASRSGGSRSLSGFRPYRRSCGDDPAGRLACVLNADLAVQHGLALRARRRVNRARPRPRRLT